MPSDPIEFDRVYGKPVFEDALKCASEICEEWGTLAAANRANCMSCGRPLLFALTPQGERIARCCQNFYIVRRSET